MVEERHRYHSKDTVSQSNQRQYEDMIDSIKKRMDPDSNTVLVVDDEDGIRRFVARNIRRSSPQTIIYEAANGEEALERLDHISKKYRKEPIFIVTDLNMPIMDGWQFIETLRKRNEEAGRAEGIPIIVLSSTSGEKGFAFMRKSVHGGKAKYHPLVSVAKEVCMEPAKFDAKGEQGLMRWMKHFMRYS